MPCGSPGWEIKALDPLRYCEFRKSHEDSDICNIFAGELVKGMAFCEGHAELVNKAIEDSGVELVKSKVLKMERSV